jgi:hypothetical protein
MGIELGGVLPDAPPHPVMVLCPPPHPEAPPQPLGPPQPLPPKDVPGIATPAPAMSPAMLRPARECLRLFLAIEYIFLSVCGKPISLLRQHFLLIEFIRKSTVEASGIDEMIILVAGGRIVSEPPATPSNGRLLLFFCRLCFLWLGLFYFFCFFVFFRLGILCCRCCTLLYSLFISFLFRFGCFLLRGATGTLCPTSARLTSSSGTTCAARAASATSPE